MMISYSMVVNWNLEHMWNCTGTSQGHPKAVPSSFSFYINEQQEIGLL